MIKLKNIIYILVFTIIFATPATISFAQSSESNYGDLVFHYFIQSIENDYIKYEIPKAFIKMESDENLDLFYAENDNNNFIIVDITENDKIYEDVETEKINLRYKISEEYDIPADKIILSDLTANGINFISATFNLDELNSITKTVYAALADNYNYCISTVSTDELEPYSIDDVAKHIIYTTKFKN